jgi:hypothetical protein
MSPLCKWLRERKRFWNTPQMAGMTGHYVQCDQALQKLPYTTREEARRIIRAMTIDLLEKKIFNPWATVKEGCTDFLFDHCIQSHWAQDVPVYHDLGFRYFPVKPRDNEYLRDLIKDRKSFLRGLIDESVTTLTDCGNKLMAAKRNLAASQASLERMSKEMIANQERVDTLHAEYTKREERVKELKKHEYNFNKE